MRRLFNTTFIHHQVIRRAIRMNVSDYRLMDLWIVTAVQPYYVNTPLFRIHMKDNIVLLCSSLFAEHPYA